MNATAIRLLMTFATGSLIGLGFVLAKLLGIDVSSLQSSLLLLVLLIITIVAGNLAGSVLQKTAGPTAYSQIGYVIALTGVAASSFVFGEELGVLFWPGLLLVFAGVLLTNSATLPKRLQAALSLHRRATAQG